MSVDGPSGINWIHEKAIVRVSSGENDAESTARALPSEAGTCETASSPLLSSLRCQKSRRISSNRPHRIETAARNRDALAPASREIVS
jgi:hypothetical protein